MYLKLLVSDLDHNLFEAVIHDLGMTDRGATLRHVILLLHSQKPCNHLHLTLFICP